MTDWWAVYQTGCVAAFVVMVVNLTTFSILNWITKANILAKNFKKLLPPTNTSFVEATAKTVLVVVIEIAMSWLSVAAGSLKLLRFVLEIIREGLSRTPEAVRKIQFPLKNNPDMSLEAVWAHAWALGVLSGDTVTHPRVLCDAIDQVLENHPRFDAHVALHVLQSLKVVEPRIIDSCLTMINGDADRYPVDGLEATYA